MKQLKERTQDLVTYSQLKEVNKKINDTVLVLENIDSKIDKFEDRFDSHDCLSNEVVQQTLIKAEKTIAQQGSVMEQLKHDMDYKIMHAIDKRIEQERQDQ